MSFKSKLKMRDRWFKKFKKAEKEYKKLHSKVISIERQCNSLARYGDKFEFKMDHPIINFSGYED